MSGDLQQSRDVGPGHFRERVKRGHLRGCAPAPPQDGGLVHADCAGEGRVALEDRGYDRVDPVRKAAGLPAARPRATCHARKLLERLAITQVKSRRQRWLHRYAELLLPKLLAN